MLVLLLASLQRVLAVPMAATMFSEVDVLLQLYLTIPATTATAERSFSALRRVRTYLRSTMTEKRLNKVCCCTRITTL